MDDPSPAILDTRAEERFARGHASAAASIPLEELAPRSHELPASRSAPLLVWDDDPARVEAACAWLRAHGFEGARAADGAWVAGLARAEGPARARLWRPHALLERWLPRVLARLGARGDPAGERRALDLAAGAGRESVRLAESGFVVEALDRDPSALARLLDLARRAGVAGRVRAREVDLEASPPPLEPASADLAVGFRFLWRPLFPAIARALRPGGVLVYQTFDERERARSGRPRSPKHLLAPGELARLVLGAGLEVEDAEEGIEATGRFMQAVLARRAQ